MLDGDDIGVYLEALKISNVCTFSNKSLLGPTWNDQKAKRNAKKTESLATNNMVMITPHFRENLTLP